VFGIPVIATNYAPTPILYTEQDLTIPKLFWDTKKERLLSFREILSPPIIQNEVGSLFQEWGYELIDNKEDELDAIVQEMLDKLDGKVLYTSADDELQQKFKALFPADFGEISARIGRDFLRKYKELLE
jgi:putative glycosyltransferase (TIGR04372 family)